MTRTATLDLTRTLALGFAYWLAFDLVLEPGGVAAALRAGARIAWDQEALRIVCAGLLGASASPLPLALVRRFPVEGPARWRHAALHLVASAALSVTLIAISCVLADWWLASERRPFFVALAQELTANATLVTFSMLGFVAIANALLPRRRAAAPAAAPRPLTHVPVRTREGLVMVETARVDWIETQGNYLALHVGGQTHLVRAAAKRFAAELDPDRFVRVHRRAIVAVDRVRALTPAGSGDAVARLDTGATLRVSRAYRARLQARLRCDPTR
ncbi:MAG TPA: LytTR family DNA-binding domain-containing protein [Caulobacteraceae bacterium]|jgi:hypothetical protein